jgi:hypothetical protein
MMAKMRHMAGINKVPFAVDYIIDLLNDTNKKYVVSFCIIRMLMSFLILP